MNTALVSTTVRQIRNSADYLNALGRLIETASHPQEIVPVADRIEIEIERLRVLVLLLRHDALRADAHLPEPAKGAAVLTGGSR